MKTVQTGPRGYGIGLALLLTLTALILWTPTRTIQIEARALSSVVEVVGEPLSWDLTGASLCLPTLNLDRAADSICGAGFLRQSPALQEPVDWDKGQRLAIRWRTDGLSIELMTDSETNGWGTGAVLWLDHDRFRENGALAFAGYLTVGEEIRAGANGYALDGRYAFFERGFLSRLLGGSPEITRTGEIRRGDRLRVLCKPAPGHPCLWEELADGSGVHANLVTGSITPALADAGFEVVGLSAEAPARLEIAYFGRDDPLLVKPDFVQRAAASSSLLVLSLFFSLTMPLLMPLLRSFGAKD